MTLEPSSQKSEENFSEGLTDQKKRRINEEIDSQDSRMSGPKPTKRRMDSEKRLKRVNQRRNKFEMEPDEIDEDDGDSISHDSSDDPNWNADL